MADLATLGIVASVKGVKEAGRDLDGLANSADRAGRSSKLLSIALREIVGPLGAVAGALFGLGRSITTIASFEKSMSAVQAVTRATADEMKDLRAVALELGESTEFSAAQAADGLKFLGMAGFTASEAIASIPAVLDLATASALGLSEAADISSNIMSGFGIEAQRAGEVADVLAAASSRANTDVRQLGDAMAYAAPVAASLNISVGDTASAVGVLSDAGIQGAKAGTGLRAVLASLVKPSREGQAALAAMGLTLKDVNPQTRSLGDIFETLRKRGLNAQAAMMLFGREAASAGLALAAGSNRVHELSEEMKGAAGEAERMAKTMRDNLSGDLDGLASAAQGLILALGDAGLTGALRSTVQAVTSVVRALSTATEYLDVLTYSAGAMALVLYRSYIPAVVAAVLQTGLWTSALVAFRTALIATGIGAVAVAIGAAVAALLRARESTDSWADAIYRLGSRLYNIWEGIKAGWQGLTLYMESLWYSMLAKVYKSTDTVVSGLLRLMGVSADSASALGDQYEFMADTSSRYAADAFSGAVQKIKDSLASFNSDDGFIGPIKPKEVASATDEIVRSLDISNDAFDKATRKQTDAYSRIITSAQERLAQMELEEQLVGKNGVAADVLRMKLDMLYEAKKKGLKLTEDQIKELNGLADAYGKVATRVAELQLMEEARFDRSQLGRSAIDQRIAADLRNSGIEMESAAGQAYASFVRTTDQIRIAKEETKSFASGFISDILRGKSALESLTGALQKLGDKLIDLALDSAINSLFGNLTGLFGSGGGGFNYFPPVPSGGSIGLFAKGGISDKPAIFGEAGPEAAVPLPDGRSIPVTLNSGASAGGPSTVNSGNVYNFTGTNEEFEQFKRFVEERDRQFDARAVHAVNKGSKKNAIRV